MPCERLLLRVIDIALSFENCKSRPESLFSYTMGGIYGSKHGWEGMIVVRSSWGLSVGIGILLFLVLLTDKPMDQFCFYDFFLSGITQFFWRCFYRKDMLKHICNENWLLIQGSRNMVRNQQCSLIFKMASHYSLTHVDFYCICIIDNNVS